MNPENIALNKKSGKVLHGLRIDIILSARAVAPLTGHDSHALSNVIRAVA